ncbi:hypothetical protein J437_LFUL002902 [Ladona fulva]|uniref:Uncharacterized protein n=1 Tax=Ladona fulva TaxID=123851 RepID=A0A8K0P737_LADFU|nr:hypothetical protein J437_LFUL002902 [Ladona fulva]
MVLDSFKGDEENMPTTTESDVPEYRSITDSVGSQSDVSVGCGGVGSTKPRMDVVCVLDVHQPEHLSERKKALEEVKHACTLVNARCHQIQGGKDAVRCFLSGMAAGARGVSVSF